MQSRQWLLLPTTALKLASLAEAKTWAVPVGGEIAVKFKAEFAMAAPHDEPIVTVPLMYSSTSQMIYGASDGAALKSTTSVRRTPSTERL